MSSISSTFVDIPIWARPSSRRNAVSWDPWRKCWVVEVTAPAAAGEANAAILAFVGERLGVGPSDMEWVHAGTSRTKRLRVRGLTTETVEERLRAQRGTSRR